MSLLLERFEKVQADDALRKACRFRCMIDQIDEKFPDNSHEIVTKMLDITPYQIKTLTYTESQYRKLEEYCKSKGLEPAFKISKFNKENKDDIEGLSISSGAH